MTWSDLVPPRLSVRTVAIEDPRDLVAWLPRDEAYAWVRDGEGMVGWGEVVRHKAASIAEAQEWWCDLVGQSEVVAGLSAPPAGAGLIAFGSFVFDPDNSAQQSQLVVPRMVLGRRHGRSWLTTIGPAGEVGWPDVVNDPPQPPRGLRWQPGALAADAWMAAVRTGLERINAGSLDKVVLARDVVAEASEDIDLRWVVRRLVTQYRRCWTYLVDGLVGATPEMLVRLESGLATSRVLAGTISRTGDPEHDLAAALSASGKDLEEHAYAVGSVAAALAPYCSGMNVPDAPYVLSLPNVLHLATDVTAVAATGVSALTLAGALHPSAAVCGTPTDVARELIAELEQLDRGRYSGPVGWIDARGDGEWAIALRCGQAVVEDPRQLRLYAGCGIVAGSDPAAELAESEAKLLPMRSALG